MNLRVVSATAAVACSLICAGGASGQAPGGKKFKFTAPDDIPIPTERSGGRTIELDLDEALRLANSGNADLHALRIGPRKSVQDLIVAQAFFDSEVYSEAGFRSQENPTLNVFQTSSETYDAQLGWRRRLRSGALLDINVTALRTEQDGRSAGNAVFVQPKLFDTSINLQVTQPLFRGAWWEYNDADIRRNEAAQREAESLFEQSRQDTLLDVARAYWEMVFSRADYRVQFQALELAQEQLRITNARIQVRDLAPRDRVADEAEVARRKESLITAENQIKQREDGLRALLFRTNSEEMWSWVLRPTAELVPDLDQVEALDWQEIARVASDRRPALQRLRRAVTIFEQILVLAEGDTLPQLDLVGAYNSGSQRLDSMGRTFQDSLDREFPDWSLRLLFSYPIGNRAAAARRDRAILDLEEARRRVLAEEIRVRTAVREAVRNMKTLAESIRASRESVRLAENDLDTAQRRQRVGTLTPFDVQERNQQLQEARSRLQRNYVDFRISEASLWHVQGLLGVSAERAEEEREKSAAKNPEPPAAKGDKDGD